MISLLCPTRGRPDSIRRFVHHALKTAEGDIEILFYVDSDDEESADTVRSFAIPEVVLVTGPRRVMSDYWNHLVPAAHGDILGLMGDDIVIWTHGWDRMVEEEFERWPDRLVFVHGRDGLQDARLGTHGFLHRDWISGVGHMTPDCFSCDYADAWINDVANALGRRVFLPGLMTEHLHPAAGKAPVDATHEERIARGARDNVAELYAAKAPERQADIDRLRKMIDWIKPNHGGAKQMDRDRKLLGR